MIPSDPFVRGYSSIKLLAAYTTGGWKTVQKPASSFISDSKVLHATMAFILRVIDPEEEGCFSPLKHSGFYTYARSAFWSHSVCTYMFRTILRIILSRV
jgi:hypothetical protein